MSLEDAIERLERASEGGPELSWAVAEALGWTKYWSGQTVYLPPGETEEWADAHPGESKASTKHPQFTTSLDAAMTLLPEGWYIYGIPRDPEGEWCPTLQRKHPSHAQETSHHNDLRLALCIACLRAKAAAA